MELLCDLHIHSRFSRATSRDLNLGQLYQWAQRKGIDVLGTGDLTHPGWRAELRDQLVPSRISGIEEPGLFELRPDLRASLDEAVPRACRRPVRFVLTGETSHIFKKGDAVRKVHNLVLLPSLDVADALSARLERLGCNITSDGRPIFGLPCRDFLELVLHSDPLSMLIPAHVWTPHFALFGSLSGFDRIEDCFGDLTKHIFALETGLSSDPAMNWRLSMLDRFTLISNSDAHSAQKLGRELTRVDLGPHPSFAGLRRAFELCDPAEFLGTIEFYPEEGKYHLDGHRSCGVRLEPTERQERGGLCPVCGKPVTVGVLSRIEALADRPEGSMSDPTNHPSRARPFESLVPLPEILGEVLGAEPTTVGVQRLYFKLLDELGGELQILRRVDPIELGRRASSLLAEAMQRVRTGRLHIAAGFDGEYGRIHLFDPAERKAEARRQQMALF